MPVILAKFGVYTAEIGFGLTTLQIDPCNCQAVLAGAAQEAEQRQLRLLEWELALAFRICERHHAVRVCEP